MPSPPAPEIVPDSQARGLVAALPPRVRALALLARFDRPIGWWLLFWPGAWAIALAGGLPTRWGLLIWFLIGSIVMRGAGCVYNDIVDRDLDASVARTRHRPLASGAISVAAAWAWLLALCGIGLIVLLQLGTLARIIALASLVLVAAYPFMKRITGWPQLWLGLVFSWAAPVGWAETWGSVSLAGLSLYAGSIAWVVGYDTIYALQDREDDALIGIGSSALSMGRHVHAGIGICYAIAVAGWTAALWQVRADPLVFLAVLPAALHLLWQVATLRPADGEGALRRFRANRATGLLVFLACAAVGTTL
ncbi:4-hydroxybenzoate octaprenyltransferase [Sphingomonas sp.]|jgi:4-hydroxybenzoate polyprenyltransferase|uniref:4-hydroxybenzoate octaprenyltransferase n=1 Tax=Sphingomonas sp. TaxID=28214 RepID=UPI0035C7BE60